MRKEKKDLRQFRSHTSIRETLARVLVWKNYAELNPAMWW